MFKLLGWKTYLGTGSAVYFVSKETYEDYEPFGAKCADTNVTFVHLGDFSEARQRFIDAGFPPPGDAHQIGLWRFSFFGLTGSWSPT